MYWKFFKLRTKSYSEKYSLNESIKFFVKSFSLFSRPANSALQIHVCNASVNETDGLFDYGIQLMDSNAKDVKDYNLVFIIGKLTSTEVSPNYLLFKEF
jgi:hypothetical protein